MARRAWKEACLARYRECSLARACRYVSWEVVATMQPNMHALHDGPPICRHATKSLHEEKHINQCMVFWRLTRGCFQLAHTNTLPSYYICYVEGLVVDNQFAQTQCNT